MLQPGDPNTFTVERSIDIAASADSVFGPVVDLRRWVEWSPWEGLDPDIRRTYEGPESGVGSSYAWEGNRKVGKGRMEILEVGAPDRVAIRLDFIKPFKSQNITTFTLTPDGDATSVTWTMVGPKTFMSRVMGLFTNMDKLVGGDFEKGLAKLKSLAEGGAST